MKIYDKVKLIKDREEYSKKGLHLEMVGTIIQPEIRDNRFYVAFDNSKIEDDYVYLCDGDMRKVDNPKKKKQKHVQATKYFHEDISKKINENIKITNKDIKNAINEIVCKEGK